MNIGVVIPCHNYGKWLPDALNSVKQQVLDDANDRIRVSVCNDGSTDDTQEVMIENATLFKNYVTCHHGHAQGPSKARNSAIKNLLDNFPDTEVIAFLDADDIMYPDKLAEMVKMFAIDEVGVVYADNDLLYVDSETRIREYREPFSMRRAVQENIGLNNTSIVRVSALQQVRFDDEQWFDNSLRTCEDYDLILRISKKWVVMHVAKCLTTLRVHGHNSTSTVSNDRWVLDRKKVLERHMKDAQRSI